MMTGTYKKDNPSLPVKNSPSEIKNNIDTLLNEIKQLPTHPLTILKPVKVFTASRSLKGQLGIPFHGFPVVAAEIPTITVRADCMPNDEFFTCVDKTFARVFNYCMSFVSYNKFNVSDEFIAAIENSKELPASTQKTIASMKGRSYHTQAHFFRDLVCTIKLINLEDLDKTELDRINYMCTKPYDYYDTCSNDKSLAYQLSKLNRLSKHDYHIVPCPETSEYTERDVAAFEKSECEMIELKGIHPTSIYESFSLQKKFDDYLNEFLLKTSPIARETKDTHWKTQQLDKMRSRLSMFSILDYKNSNKTNCNKSTASFLETAADHSQFYKLTDHDRPDNIHGASYYSVGSSLRMFFSGSFIPRLTEQLYKDEKMVLTPNALQSLINRKDEIYREIHSWKHTTKITALKAICNPDTSLGRVFHGKRSGNLLGPKITSGTLAKAKAELDALTSNYLKL